MTNKIELKQDTPGSWTHIAIMVNGIKQFHAAKQGTNFWVIVEEQDRNSVIGFGDGRSGVKAKVTEYLEAMVQ